MRETAIEFAYCCASVADDDCVFAHRFVEEVYGPRKGGERFTVSQNGGISLFKQSTSHFVRRSECIFSQWSAVLSPGFRSPYLFPPSPSSHTRRCCLSALLIQAS